MVIPMIFNYKRTCRRQLLVTASAVAIVASYIGSANAATKQVNGNVAFVNGVNWLPGAAAPVDNDDIIFNNNGYTVNANIANRIIAAINLNAKNPGLFTITDSFSAGSIGNKGMGTGLNMQFAAGGQTLTLTGTAGGSITANNYSGLTDIDFNGHASTVKINKDNAILGTNFHGHKTGGGSAGTIEINAANVVFNGTFDQTNGQKVLSLVVNDAKSLTVNSVFSILGDATIGAGATLKLANHAYANDIKGSAVGNGTLEFNNTVFHVANLGIGNGNKVNVIRLSGHDVEITKTIKTNSIDFTRVGSTTLRLSAGQDIGGLTVTTNSTTRSHNIELTTGDQTITGNFGTAQNLLGNIKLLADQKVSINSTNFYASVHSLSDKTGTVIFVKDGSFAYGLGSIPSNIALKHVQFSANGEVRGGINADLITIDPGKTATFASGQAIGPSKLIQRPTIVTNKLLLRKGSVAIFNDGALVEGPIMTDIDGHGTLEFKGNTHVRKQLGEINRHLSKVTFNSQ